MYLHIIIYSNSTAKLTPANISGYTVFYIFKFAGFGQPRVYLGADAGVGDGLGLMEGGDVCLPSDRRHGLPGSGHAQETQQAIQRSQG